MPREVPFLEINDYNVRLNQYLEAIEFYIKYTKVKDIAFVENSNFTYDYSDVYDLAKNHNKNIEILAFEGDHKKTSEYGKGYGEGEIIKYFYINSELLKRHGYFIKVTGRFKLLNIDEILKSLEAYCLIVINQL